MPPPNQVELSRRLPEPTHPEFWRDVARAIDDGEAYGLVIPWESLAVSLAAMESRIDLLDGRTRGA